MKNKRILFDQDDVLADFHQGFIDVWRTKGHSQPAVELEELKHFGVAENYPAEWRQQVYDIYCAPGFFRNLKPVPQAISALRQLTELGHDVWICTSPLQRYRNCVPEKYEWVEQHLGMEFTSRMILTRDKTLVKGDFLLDDKPNVQGAAVPEWQHVIVDRPYNRNVEGPRITWANMGQQIESLIST